MKDQLFPACGSVLAGGDSVCLVDDSLPLALCWRIRVAVALFLSVVSMILVNLRWI
jgi:hypothetical protein